MAFMVGWEGVALPTAMGVTGVMVGILSTPGAAILPQTPTVVVMATVRHLVLTTTVRTEMERVVETVDTVDMEDTARLPITLVTHREVVLLVIIIVVQRRAGAGVGGGDRLFLQRYSYMTRLVLAA